MRVLFFIILLLFFCFRSFSINQNDLNAGESCESSVQTLQTFQSYISNVLREKDKKLPSDFHRRINSWSSSEAQQFLDILSERIGNDQIVAFLQKRSSFFQNISYDTFIELLEFYEQYIGKEFFDKQLAEPSHWLSIFDNYSLTNVQKKIETMEEVFGKEQTLRILRNDIRFAINILFYEIRSIYEFVVELFGEDFTNKLMESEGHGFGLLRINRIKPVVKFLMEKIDLNTEEMKLLFLQHLYELAEIQLIHLKSLIRTLILYIGEEGVRYLIQKSFSAIYNISRKDIEPVVKFIEKYLGREGVGKRLQSGISSFNYIDIDTLKDLEKEWGKDKMRDNLEKYGLRHRIFRKKQKKTPSASKDQLEELSISPQIEEQSLSVQTRLDSLGLYVDFLDEYLTPKDWGLWLRKNIDSAYNQKSMQELEKSVTAVKKILDKDEIKKMIITDYKKFIVWVEAFLKFYPHIDKERWVKGFQNKSVNQIKQISAVPDIINRYAGAVTLNILLERYHDHIFDIDFKEFQSLIHKIESHSGSEGVATLLYERFYIFL